jgi:hypothetical protein
MGFRPKSDKTLPTCGIVITPTHGTWKGGSFGERLQPLLPDSLVTLGVNAPNDFDAIGLDKKEYFVREPAGQNPPHVFVEDRMMERMVGDIAKGNLDLSEKLVTQAGLPFFVPIESFGQ